MSAHDAFNGLVNAKEAYDARLAGLLHAKEEAGAPRSKASVMQAERDADEALQLRRQIADLEWEIMQTTAYDASSTMPDEGEEEEMMEEREEEGDDEESTAVKSEGQHDDEMQEQDAAERAYEAQEQHADERAAADESDDDAWGSWGQNASTDPYN